MGALPSPLERRFFEKGGKGNNLRLRLVFVGDAQVREPPSRQNCTDLEGVLGIRQDDADTRCRRDQLQDLSLIRALTDRVCDSRSRARDLPRRRQRGNEPGQAGQVSNHSGELWFAEQILAKEPGAVSYPLERRWTGLQRDPSSRREVERACGGRDESSTGQEDGVYRLEVLCHAKPISQ